MPNAEPEIVVSHSLQQGPTGWSVPFIGGLFAERRFKAAEPFEMTVDAAAADPAEEPQPPLSDEEPEVEEGPHFWSRSLELSDYRCARVGGPAAPPYAAVGRILARLNGANKSGSAWAAGRKAIMTAGHCLFNDAAGCWIDALQFAPQFQGTPLLGTWRGVSAHVLAGWRDTYDRAYDMGVVILEKPLPVSVAPVGCLYNSSPNASQFQGVGYPEIWYSNDFPFDGNVPWYCTGRQLGAGRIQKMASPMTRGASGGPWFVQKDQTVYANGLNSYRLTTEPEQLRSPYFGAGVGKLMEVIEAAGAL
jgi:V8-like Glu-specific endopeptidase